MRFFPLLFLLMGCTLVQKSPENQKLVFDHTFTVIEDEKDFFSLEDRGFVLDKKPVRHPGPVECRFIKFAPSSYPFFQYLEWCYTPSFEKMNSKMKKKGEDGYAWTGLGFRTYGDVEKIFDNLKSEFEEKGIYYFHKNFEWEKNSKDKLEGWDYISFKKTLVDDISFFGIKYGKPKGKRGSQPSHPNSAVKIIAAIIDLENDEIENIAKFSMSKLHKGVIPNDYGFTLVNFSNLDERVKAKIGKKGKYKAVVLKFNDENDFRKMANPDYQFEFKGQVFYGIRAHSRSWDILATDCDDFISALGKPE